MEGWLISEARESIKEGEDKGIRVPPMSKHTTLIMMYFPYLKSTYIVMYYIRLHSIIKMLW